MLNLVIYVYPQPLPTPAPATSTRDILHESGKAFLAGNLDPELFCTCRGEGSRAFPNPYKALGWRMASSTVLT